jgi:hypothetical protein
MVSRSVIRRKISRIEEHIRRIRAIPPVSLEGFKKDTMSQDVFLFNITQARCSCKKSINAKTSHARKGIIKSFYMVRKAWFLFFKGIPTFCRDIRQYRTA